MSDQWTPEFDVGEVPTGRKVPSYTGTAGWFGTIKTLSEADDASLAVARRTWREFDDQDLERIDHRNFRHRQTGEPWV